MTKLTTFTTVEELAAAIAKELYAIQLSNGPLSKTSANEVAHNSTNDVVKSTDNTHHAKDKELLLQVTNQLHRFGIPENLLGYKYLRYGLYISYKDKSIFDSITKILYPTVAENFNTNSRKVERAIRHAIHVANSSGSVSYNEKFPQGAPSNSLFIGVLLDELVVLNGSVSDILI